jgi:hypothetical protein
MRKYLLSVNGLDSFALGWQFFHFFFLILCCWSLTIPWFYFSYNFPPEQIALKAVLNLPAHISLHMCVEYWYNNPPIAAPTTSQSELSRLWVHNAAFISLWDQL